MTWLPYFRVTLKIKSISCFMYRPKFIFASVLCLVASIAGVSGLFSLGSFTVSCLIALSIKLFHSRMVCGKEVSKLQVTRVNLQSFCLLVVLNCCIYFRAYFHGAFKLLTLVYICYHQYGYKLFNENSENKQ